MSEKAFRVGEEVAAGWGRDVGAPDQAL